MTEDEARSWVTETFGTLKYLALERFVSLLEQEAERQNLIAASTKANIWSRHIVDSAQLVRPARTWCDIGSGAGLPGLVVAILTDTHISLIEPRKLRASFLEFVARELAISDRIDVLACRVETVPRESFDVITARAVAPLAKFLGMAAHLSTANTQWVLPRGRNAHLEVEQAKRAWHGTFHVEQSVVDPESQIVVATGVRTR